MSTKAPIISRENSTAYQWANQGEGQYLLRTVEVLASRQPGVQFIESSRTSQVYAIDADWAEGVAFANDVAEGAWLNEMGA